MLPFQARPPLAISLATLDDPALPRGARDRIAWAAGAGFRAVAINAADPELRPRTLDRSARRDLAALLRRSELAMPAVELWIPPEHFASPEHADRAVAALASAAQLAADLAALTDASAVVATRFDEHTPAETLAAIDSAAARCGAVIADHRWPATGEGLHPSILIGADTAAMLGAGDDPPAGLAAVFTRLAAVRLGDTARTSQSRVLPGKGRLDLDACAATLLSLGWTAPVVLDASGIPDQAAAVRQFARDWPINPQP